MELFDDASEFRVNGLRLGEPGGVVNLLGVAVHLHAAFRTDHLSLLCHATLQSVCVCRGRKPSASSSLFERYVLAPVAQHFRHPDQLLEKLVEPSDVCSLLQLARSVEGAPDGGEVRVPEDRDESELAHHGQEVLDDARPAEGACGDAADACGLVYILAQVRVERVLEQPRIAVVVLRHDENKGVGAHARLGELRVLDPGAGVARREVQLAYINQLALDALALADFAEDEARDVLAHAPLPRRAEDDRYEKWAGVCHAVFSLTSIRRS